MDRRPFRGKRGFTLIELLVVIGILALLAGILLPAINAVLKQQDATRAKGEVASLVTAWKNYYNEYGQWPVGRASGDGQYECMGQAAGEDGLSPESAGIATSNQILRCILMPRWRRYGASSEVDAIDAYNPKRLMFLEYEETSIDTNKWDLVDPWGNTYRFMFDLDFDGKVHRADFDPVYGNVIVWSLGPNGKNGVNQADPDAADNINSWE